MSLFGIRHRLQEAVRQEPAGGNANSAPEFLKPFGEHGKAFESFKDPASLSKAWVDIQNELKTLKESAGKFDWRKEIGGDDAEAQKVLARFSDPKTFFKSFSEAQAKIRSGELAKPLAADATPEQIAEWRKANGVPEKLDAYFEKLPNGRVIGKDDQPMFNQVAERLHKLNVPTSVMHDLVDWYYTGQESQAAAERQVDQADSQKATLALKEAYGDDYKPNMGILENWLEGMGKDLKAKLKDAVLGDGTRLMNNVDAVKWLVSQARSANPLAGLLPTNGEGDLKSLESEIAAIEKTMRENRPAYNKDEKMQERYRNLIDARLKLQGK